MKTCTKCKIDKPFEFFGVHSGNKDGYQYQCRPCRKESCADSFKRKSKELKEQQKSRTNLWKQLNPEKVKAYRKEYRSKNQSKFTALERKRYASKLQRTPKWLTEFDYLYMECLYQVAAMRTKESGQEWHVDHIVPLQGKTVSGLHVPSNLQVIPATENLRKKNTYVS